MKVIIAGSRTFNDFLVFSGFMSVLPLEWDITEIVSGGAKGADALGEEFGHMFGIPVKVFSANWSSGKQAGIMRNIEMGKYADGLIAFWNGTSPGTKHMIQYMYSVNKPVHIFYVGDN